MTNDYKEIHTNADHFEYRCDESSTSDDKNNKVVTSSPRIIKLSQKDPNSRKKYRHQRYRQVWEEELEFSSWLTRCPTDQENAYCKACLSRIQPRIASIKQHSLGSKHIKNLKHYDDTKNDTTSSGCDAEERNHPSSFHQVENSVVPHQDRHFDRETCKEIVCCKRMKPDIYTDSHNLKHSTAGSVTTSPSAVDNYAIFGDYVANELRNLSSEFLKRKLKRVIQKSILEIAEEEELMLSKPASSENAAEPQPQMYATYILTDGGDAIHSKGILACHKDNAILYETGAS